MIMRAVSDIQRLLDEVAPFLLMAGVPARQIRIAKGIDYKIQTCAKAYDWLHQFSMSPELHEIKKVRALRPESVWEHYTLIGVTELAEQDMLRDAGIALIKRWRVKRPRLFGPDKQSKEEFYAENEGCEQESNCTGFEGLCIQSN